MFYVGLGVRLPLPWEGRLTPYRSGAFDLAWWRFVAEDLPCDAWYCSTDRHFHVAPGFRVVAASTSRSRYSRRSISATA